VTVRKHVRVVRCFNRQFEFLACAIMHDPARAWQVYKQWPVIFNNDSVLTSALLDRLLHHSETVRIEGKSYRMKDQIEA